MQCSKFGEDSTPCRRGRAAWMTRPRPNEQFARRADNQARAMAAIAVGEREEWTAPQRVKPVHSGVLHVLSGWSCRKARTARAARNGTAFFAVAPRERPASAHSPRTAKSRFVRQSPCDVHRRSLRFLPLLGVPRAHRHGSPAHCSLPGSWQLRATSAQAAKESCAPLPNSPLLPREGIRPRAELMRNASARIGASDRILNEPI